MKQVKIPVKISTPQLSKLFVLKHFRLEARVGIEGRPPSALQLRAQSHALPQDASHGKAAKFVLIKLSITWIIVLNAVGWLSIQMGLAWGFTKMPVNWYNPGRTRFWERSEPFNEVVFRIEAWKVWFGGGFAKRTLAEKNRH